MKAIEVAKMRHRSNFPSAALILMLLSVSCSSGYDATTRPSGIEASELACARRVYLGEDTHLGMPHVPRDERTVDRIARVIRRDIPDLIIVNRPEESDFVISVLLVPAIGCSHCDPRPDTEWMAIVERGGSSHRTEYPTLAPFLELSGHVREGVSASWGFVRQLRELTHQGACQPPNSR